MDVTTLAPPAAEPVSVAEAREYLRVGTGADDGLIGRMVAAARARIEAAAGIALIHRTLRVTLDAWPAGTIETRSLRLPMRPAAELSAVRVDEGGGLALVTDRFALAPGAGGRLVWTEGAFPWARGPMGVEIDYRAGFAATGAGVPDDLKLAALRLVAHAYLARDEESLAGPPPADVDALLAPFRRVRL